MFDILKMWAKTGTLTELPQAVNESDIDLYLKNPSEINKLSYAARKALSRSLIVRHLDSGSCNAEEAELIALSNPFYDISRFGIDFTASPRHADVLTVSGPLTRHLKVAMERTYNAMPHPKIVVAIGDGACNGSIYENTYANLGRVDKYLPVDLYIPGDPPSPDEIIKGLLVCKLILAKKVA